MRLSPKIHKIKEFYTKVSNQDQAKILSGFITQATRLSHKQDSIDSTKIIKKINEKYENIGKD